MKKLLTAVLCTACSIAFAQWSDTGNNFYDSLHMAVCIDSASQRNPLALTSYPDGGYFVIWEDDRNTATSKTDIYAQKYDRNGNRLWAAGGIPVSTAPNNQHYTFSSNQDYRNRSFAATDSAGGFYITYVADSITNYYWGRIAVQHVRSDGTKVFAEPGYIVAQSAGANFYDFMWPQLVADGNKGFFIAYKQSYYELIHAACYRDEDGKMVYYGGGRMNENAYQSSSIAPCGIKTDVNYPSAATYDYNIWYDGDGGCNIVMSMIGNNGQGATGPILGFNRLWRAKKDSKTKTFFRNTSGAACPRITEYKKNDVYRLYYLAIDFQSVFCSSESVAYSYTNYRLLSNGYFVIDQGNAYDYNYPKGVTVRTDSNINVNLIAVTRRKYENNVISDFTVQGYAYPVEKFDSLPYQRISYNDPDFGYNYKAPAGLKKLNNFRDTLLAAHYYYVDFSIAAGGNEIYASALMSTLSNQRQVRLQNLLINRKTADSFAVEYSTAASGKLQRAGVAIGAEVSTGAGGSSISYDLPLLASTPGGRFLFYIREYYRGARVSPVISGTELEWGAMGVPIGTGIYHYSNTWTSYNLEQPVIALDPDGINGVIVWRDNRYLVANAASYDNIYIRHLDLLNSTNQTPPEKRVRALSTTGSNPYFANPAVLYGTSNEFSVLEGRTNDVYTIPLVSIQDYNYLGNIDLRTYQHVGPPRRHNNEAFLNRNFSIKPDSLRPGADYSMLLYFTKAEFEALKNAEFVVQDPGFLSVIRQPSTVATVPAAYTPVAGEELLTPIAWDSVDGGFYVWVRANGLGNFFLKKLTTTSTCSATNASFSSNITGTEYRWQVNTGGTVYLDITDNANYSGTGTATLQVNNIPSSFNGYRYRCRVDATKASNSFILQVANTWTGAVNNQWETAGNWSCNKVPDANTDVVINSGTVTVNTNTATCRSIRVSTTANLSITPGFKLTVTH